MLSPREKTYLFGREPRETIPCITEETRERATYDAGQRLLDLISLAHSRLSRGRLADYAHDLAGDMMDNATLEDLRAWCMRLEEEMGL